MADVLGPRAERCATELRGKGIDLSAYNTEASADDLDDLRRALGAEKISLFGFSYGTHLALAAVRRHPERIDRVILAGTEGPDHSQKLPHTFDLLRQGAHKKGDVLAVARIAGIQAAKKCADLIPLCHPLMLTSVEVNFELAPEAHRVNIEAVCKVTGKTGVEMEALTAVSVAALTIYDMCKAVDKGMEIHGIRLLSKEGGKSGAWRRDAEDAR